MKAIFDVAYRPFFLVGILGLLLGLGVWVIFGLVNPDFYFGQMHAHYMIGVFVLSFVIGFLMTAIPRMSGGAGASHLELVVQAIPLLSGAFWGLFEDQEKIFFGWVAVTLLVLIVFCAKRLRSSKQPLPEIFPMVITGLFSGLLGSILMLFDYSDLGRRLFYVNLVLALCVGIGAKLLPMLLRHGLGSEYKKGEMWTVGLLLMSSCFLEAQVNEVSGAGLRALVMTVVIFRHWKVHRLEGTFTALGLGVRVAALSIYLGTVGLYLFPDYRLEALHVLYVSGFALLTLMVASRVILAHGGFDLNHEFRSWYLRLPLALIVVAMATRVSAVFVIESYERHLAYAALALLLAVAVWGSFFVPKVLRPRA